MDPLSQDTKSIFDLIELRFKRSFVDKIMLLAKREAGNNKSSYPGMQRKMKKLA